MSLFQQGYFAFFFHYARNDSIKENSFCIWLSAPGVLSSFCWVKYEKHSLLV